MKIWWLLLMTRSRRDSATTGLGNSGHLTVLRRPVRGQHERAAGPFGDELVEVIGLGGGELAHREVVQDQDGGPGEFAEPLVPGVVGVPAGEVGQGAAGLEEPDVRAVADGEVAEDWAMWLFPTPTRQATDCNISAGRCRARYV